MPKDTVIFVNAIRPATFAALKAYKKQTGRTLKPVVLVDTKIDKHISTRNLQTTLSQSITKITADFDSPAALKQALEPYQDRIFAVTSQYENSILELKKLVPYFPYLPMPTESSLEWATEKKLMRQHLEAHNPDLVPGYKEVFDHKEATIAAIESDMNYPLIVKPSGLEGSLLVTRVDNADELRRTLARTFREMQKAYDKWIKRQTPTILVEEFMEGDMYSVDTYVNQYGECRHTPVVKVITGRKAGFDDFFGYMQTAPCGLKDQEIEEAHLTAEQACKALCLRSVTAHVELMKTKTGWKIVELGPRIGGFRHDIYLNSYGINHIVNDILNRAGETPVIPTKLKSHTIFFNIYARQEGTLHSIHGLEHIKSLPSLLSISQNIQLGEVALSAKNNGDPIFVVSLTHKDEAQFLKDVHAVQNMLHLNVHSSPDLPEAYMLGLMTDSQKV